MQTIRVSSAATTLLHAAVIAALATPASFTLADTVTKLGTGTDLAQSSSWQNTTNQNVVPTSTDVAYFGSTSLGGTSLTLSSAANWGELYDNGATSDITLSNSSSTQLTLTGGQSAGGTTNSGLYISSTGVNFTSSNTIAIALGSTQAWTVSSGKTAQLNGVISDGGNAYGINAAVAGTLELYGANSFSGGVTLSGSGIIDITQSTGLGTGTFNFSSTSAGGGGLYARQNNPLAVANNIILPNTGGQYVILKGVSSMTNVGTALTLSGSISGGGTGVTLELNDTSATDTATTYLVSGTNNFSTGTNLLIKLGNFVVGNKAALTGASVTLQSPTNTTNATGGGNLQFNVGGTFNNAIALSSSSVDTINTNVNAVALSGTITGNAGLTKFGSGTLSLSSANTYSGGTTINAGTLQANTAGRVLSGSTLQSSATGTGTVTISQDTTANTKGVLAGNGGTGDVVVNTGGTITAGTGATTSDTVGTLYTGSEAWNSGGTFAAKIGTAGNDELVMTGLTRAESGFTIQITGLSGKTFTAGQRFVIADAVGGSLSTFESAVTNGFTLTTTGTASGQAFTLSEQPDTTVGFVGEDLVVTAAPEPASAILFGVAAAPLLMERRRRSRKVREHAESVS